ncbi:Sphingoid long-chain base transporter RSB1 [Escovopsis weberi]|uniref:Sphingoid long-chain base transporter RSB1 n=1 Tax=Escovopsis weberi TaxID=150374 RepID=A0A0M8N0P2_ESCWE|nr:Sphingoid long-chain base transporter RSB1 [Escovopsis weberi]
MSSTTSHMSLRDCTDVSPFCPVSATVLGYYPNLGSGIFFALAFGLLLLASLILGIWKRTYTYCLGLTLGLILEMAGYVGRALLHHNPWAEGPFDLQITAIILAPSFICVSIYLTLKHVAITLDPAASRLRPKWYPIIFLPADLSCLVVQAAGGGIAAGNKTNHAAQVAGNRAIMAGVVLQVVVLLIFGGLSADYFVRLRRRMAAGQAPPSAARMWDDANFRKFVFAVLAAYTLIFIRCIYRIAEMAGGWGNTIMQDEPSFLVLDSSLMLVASAILTIVHPGIFFPQMSKGRGAKQAAGVGETSASSGDVTPAPEKTSN